MWSWNFTFRIFQSNWSNRSKKQTGNFLKRQEKHNGSKADCWLFLLCMIVRYGTRNWAFRMLGNIFPTVIAACTWYWKPWPNTRIVRIAKRTHYCRSTKFASYLIGGSRIKTILHRVNSNISDILSTLKRELISFKPHNLAVYQFYNVTENRGQAGRPRVRIEEEILFHFRNIGYSWKEIAELLLVSR